MSFSVRKLNLKCQSVICNYARNIAFKKGPVENLIEVYINLAWVCDLVDDSPNLKLLFWFHLREVLENINTDLLWHFSRRVFLCLGYKINFVFTSIVWTRAYLQLLILFIEPQEAISCGIWIKEVIAKLSVLSQSFWFKRKLFANDNKNSFFLKFDFLYWRDIRLWVYNLNFNDTWILNWWLAYFAND